MVQEAGNQLLVLHDDGTRQLAYPTGNGVWVVSGTGGGGPTPTGWILPVDPQFDVNRPLGDFGPRDLEGGSSFHNGVDFNGAGMSGHPIKAVFNGTVRTVGTNAGAGFGYYVIIDHPDGSATLYAHMLNPPPVSVGQSVSTGDVIGATGSTGQSTGTHLHFETHENGSPVDPEPFMLARGVVIPVS